MGKDAKAKKAKRKKKPVFIGLDENNQPPDFPYVATASSSIHNQGLFAAKRIPKDEYIIQYLGERITKKESNRRGVDQHDKSQAEGVGSVYIFEIDDKHDIDGNFDWNIARLANHSCDPNCEAQDVEGEIWLVALRTIKKGEELTFDYGYALEHWRDHPCRCGSKNCVGYIVRRDDWGKLKKVLKKEKKTLQAAK
ncbi:SET domain-containing protein-lysine N-methyltransferase [Pelagicoccus sp. SDUM812003]|uniref:SET domain-containing protein n=1 Tax=Pelagicoccus sp. SDUM812003 TaxID=3041267 RepID=UPI00280ECB40|nr:SET domain-containing protein-lysine N-methyltransferase [Pelagicoccus sp. SDUM812003]MDQ8201616.1 SET domain-containing protein-lysine N-methyltransferase [Pelagicoccus sp. SDUM812003]